VPTRKDHLMLHLLL
jgi:hypothetical protein